MSMFITTEDGKEHELSGGFDTQIDIPPAQEKISVHERLKTVSVISPPPDGESVTLYISPKDFTIGFSQKRERRWRNVQKAYKLMRMIEPKVYLGRGYWAVIDRRGAKDGNAPTADFIPVVAWDKLAEVIGNHLSKGRRVMIEGRIQVRSYEGQDGAKRYVTEIIAQEMEFLDSRNDSGGQSQTSGGFNDAQSEDEEIPF